VAPAVLVYLWTLDGVPGVGWALAMLFATCCALRLARFNSSSSCPTGRAGPTSSSPASRARGGRPGAHADDALVRRRRRLAAELGAERVLLVFVAVMMVSRVPTYSFKRVRVEPHMVLPTLLVAFVVIAGSVTETWLTLSIIAGIYLLSIPLSVWTAGRMRRRDQPHPGAVSGAAAHPAPPPAPAPPSAERVVTFEPRAGHQRPG
jgi:CDP-diacylglycerol--serine O-phosphatidyltransferase